MVEDNIQNYSPDQIRQLLSVQADNYDLDALVQRNAADLSPNKEHSGGDRSGQKLNSIYSPNQSGNGMVSKFYESPPQNKRKEKAEL